MSAAEPEGPSGQPVPDMPDVAGSGSRFRPGFPWGLAVGAIVVAAVVATAYVLVHFAALRQAESFGGRSKTVVVTASKAGKPWIKVSATGSGTLEAWSSGSSGSGDNYGAGIVADFDVGQVDVEHGVTFRHCATIHVTHATEFLVGGQPYKKGKYKSAAEALFNASDGPMESPLEGRPLTIFFHVVDGRIVADRITAPLEVSDSPLNEY